MSESVRVTTGSRLHFGLLRFASMTGPSFGGVGMMIDQPQTKVDVAASDQWQASGPASDRATEFGQLAVASLPAGARPLALRVTVEDSIPPHRGLGGGTQLALAVAAATRALAGLPIDSAAELAASVSRGLRSAIGTHGFLHGGLIYDGGYSPPSSERTSLGGLAARRQLPDAWRIVLVAPAYEIGRSGRTEQDAFAALPPVPRAVTARLIEIIDHHILPATDSTDCNAFGEAIFDYGRLAGECFAPIQGGPYATLQIAEIVAELRRRGVHGVGQSSWGPTVFAIVESQDAVDCLLADLPQSWRDARFDIGVAKPLNFGATVN